MDGKDWENLWMIGGLEKKMRGEAGVGGMGGNGSGHNERSRKFRRLKQMEWIGCSWDRT